MADSVGVTLADSVHLTVSVLPEGGSLHHTCSADEHLVGTDPPFGGTHWAAVSAGESVGEETEGIPLARSGESVRVHGDVVVSPKDCVAIATLELRDAAGRATRVLLDVPAQAADAPP
jgi:hypothetical protein